MKLFSYLKSIPLKISNLLNNDPCLIEQLQHICESTNREITALNREILANNTIKDIKKEIFNKTFEEEEITFRKYQEMIKKVINSKKYPELKQYRKSFKQHLEEMRIFFIKYHNIKIDLDNKTSSLISYSDREIVLDINFQISETKLVCENLTRDLKKIVEFEIEDDIVKTFELEKTAKGELDDYEIRGKELLKELNILKNSIRFFIIKTNKEGRYKNFQECLRILPGKFSNLLFKLNNFFNSHSEIDKRERNDQLKEKLKILIEIFSDEFKTYIMSEEDFHIKQRYFLIFELNLFTKIDDMFNVKVLNSIKSEIQALEYICKQIGNSLNGYYGYEYILRRGMDCYEKLGNISFVENERLKVLVENFRDVLEKLKEKIEQNYVNIKRKNYKKDNTNNNLLEKINKMFDPVKEESLSIFALFILLFDIFRLPMLFLEDRV